MDFSQQDYQYMIAALDCAKQGSELGEVPVGAVIVYQQQIIATGFNQPILSHDATAHAEIVAIRQACQHFANYRLPQGCELFVTLEPCTMCLGAIIHARISRVVFATTEPKAGMLVSRQNFYEQDFYNHFLRVQQGLMADDSRQLLQQFFRQRRAQKKSQQLP